MYGSEDFRARSFLRSFLRPAISQILPVTPTFFELRRPESFAFVGLGGSWPRCLSAESAMPGHEQKAGPRGVLRVLTFQ